MTDPRIRGASAAAHHSPKMESELSPRRTMVVLVIVVGCFAVLWPKVFYPMLVGSANEHIKPSAIDKTTGCCDVISETDVNTIKIMTELCGSIINATGDRLGGEVVQKCKREILETCGIDVSAVLQEQVRLGQNVKQILDEIRSLNGSLCLKYNYGVAPWRLGVPHRVTVKMASQAPKTLILFINGPDGEAIKKLNGSKWVRRLEQAEAVKEAQKEEKHAKAKPVEVVPLSKIPFPKYVALDQCKKSDFEKNDKCFCAVDSVLSSVKQGENSTGRISCLDFLKVDNGVVIGNESIPHVRKKRSYWFGKYDVEVKREVIDYSKGFFDEDFKIHNTEARIYALPGTKIVVPCLNRNEVVEYNRYMKYIWTFEDELPITDNQIQETEGNLILENVLPKDSGNYTCTVKSRLNEKSNVVQKYQHGLVVVSTPIYKVTTSIIYELKEPCELSDGDVISLYFPNILDGLLCGYHEKMCKVEVRRPVCVNREEEKLLNVTFSVTMLTLKEIVPNLDANICNLNCQIEMYSKLAAILVKNLKTFVKLPVFSKLSLKEQDFNPKKVASLNHKEKGRWSTPPVLMVLCPAGFGVERKEPRVCVVCPKNTYNVGAESYCKICPAGQYQPVAGSKSCIACSSSLENKACLRVLYTNNIRQERPMHLRSELIHPAFRERGRAIPQPQAAPPARPPPRVVEGRPGPLPGMRPTIGGAGHVVPPPKQGTSSMSVIMPIYTIGIVIFFTYTLMKIIFKKQPEGVGAALYPPVTPDPHFRKEVFESGARYSRESISSKLVVNAMSALLDEVDQEIEARRKSSEVAAQDLVNGGLSNGDAVKPQDEVQPTVKVLGMEMTASCEGGKKWSRPGSPVLPTPSPPPPPEPAPPPQEIYLEGALPAQSQLLVADSATEPVSGEDPAVVLSGKMTLSVISPDSENGAEETTPNEEIIDKNINDITNLNEETDKEIEEQILQYENHEPEMGLEKDIQDFLHNLQQQNDVQTPSITLESDDLKESLEVEKLEKEVDELIQEAIEKIQEKAVETKENHDEIKDNGVNTEETEETGCQIPPTKPKDDESASDDEIVEEIVYEEESEDEEIEVEVEESDDEEMLNDRNFNRTDSSSARRVNGERSEDLVEESKYTTVSGATAAENDISDEELTDDEEVEEEEIEIEDEEYVNEENVNHVAGDSDSEA